MSARTLYDVAHDLGNALQAHTDLVDIIGEFEGDREAIPDEVRAIHADALVQSPRVRALLNELFTIAACES